MKLIYPSQSVASALRSLAPGLYVRVRDACDRQYIWRPLATGAGPCDIVIQHHFRVHPVRPLDKGDPSFPATCEFDHCDWTVKKLTILFALTRAIEFLDYNYMSVAASKFNKFHITFHLNIVLSILL